MPDRPLTLKQLTEPASEYFVGSRSYIYTQIAAGELQAKKFGRAVRVMQSERERFIASRPAADIRLGGQRSR
ncbi:putative DNA-binding transcriptional regulator AlpA [Kaistia dalseonensis]|uniref:DNA-binding transcriptional regulator AlpA n=1 Tax=Kaistia dalseonensis TaxID=410840 RepID=A0ABU0H8Y8_9HYPH|nr:putative DNA-binding transcriptional regulator AlpA [Kaistia dalseonensis]